MYIISFHLPFDNFRPLTNKKANIIEGFFKAKKWIFNQVNNDFTTNNCFPYYPSKDDITFTKKFYYNHISDISNLKSFFSQNISNQIVQNFISTKKSFFSKSILSKKSFFKTPKQHSFQSFPLDFRMLSAKDSFVIENDYRAWLKLSNPFKNNSSKFINIPVKLFPKVNILLKQGFKYTFNLKSDGIDIVFKCPNLQLIDIHSASKKLAIDFGKFTSTFLNNGSVNQYDLSKMYNKIKKIKSDIDKLSSEISIMKEKNE